MIVKMKFIIESGCIFTFQSALQLAAFMSSSTHFYYDSSILGSGAKNLALLQNQ